MFSMYKKLIFVPLDYIGKEMSELIMTTEENTQEVDKLQTLRNIGYPSDISINIEGNNLLNDKLKEKIYWALNKPEKLVKIKGGINLKEQEAEKKAKERKWGNKMINQNDNGQFTTKLGEGLVKEILELRGENPKKVVKKEGFEPDWETDDYIYEVKTSNWWVDGTAGEKVLGTFIKYQNIPELFGKPLRIVCVAYQEYELEFGKTQYFGENVTKKTKQALDLAKSWDIEYMRFSDLVKPLINNS